MAYRAEFSCCVAASEEVVLEICSLPGINVLRRGKKGDPVRIGIREFDTGKTRDESFVAFNFGEETIGEFFENISEHSDVIRRSFVDDREVSLGIHYVDQCNFEFSPEELKIISEMNFHLSISCYEDD